MKSGKQLSVMIGLALVLAFTSLQGQTATRDNDDSENARARQQIVVKGLRGYTANLRSEVDGVIESTIFHIVTTRITAPEQNYDKIIDELKRLSFGASQPGLRYKAYLAASVLPELEQILAPAQVEHVLALTEETRTELFAILSAALHGRLAD